MLECSKTFSSKRKKVNLTKYVYSMVGVFYNILSRVRRFTVLCLPLQLNVSPSIAFPVYSHGWVRHLDVSASTPFVFQRERWCLLHIARGAGALLTLCASKDITVMLSCVHCFFSQKHL